MDVTQIGNQEFENLAFKIRDGIIFRDLDDEVIIMDTNSGRYSGLNETGARIWTMIAESCNIRTIIETLCREYNANETLVMNETREFIQNLLAQELIETADAEENS